MMFFDPNQALKFGEQYRLDLTPGDLEIQTGDRRMAAHLCWKSDMHNPRLPALLRRVAMTRFYNLEPSGRPGAPELRGTIPPGLLWI